MGLACKGRPGEYRNLVGHLAVGGARKLLKFNDIYKVIKETIARLGFEPKLTVHETVVLTTTQSRLSIVIIVPHFSSEYLKISDPPLPK